MSSKPAPSHLRLIPSSKSTTDEPELIQSDAPVTVDPGQVIKIGARFPGTPERVFFSYLAPGETEAVHDPGFGAPDSKVKLEGDTYRAAIDTRTMRGGTGWWYFLSEDDTDPENLQRAKLGQFVVREAPRALFRLGEDDVPLTGYETLARTKGKGMPGWVWFTVGALCGALLR